MGPRKMKAALGATVFATALLFLLLAGGEEEDDFAADEALAPPLQDVHLTGIPPQWVRQ